MSAASPVRIAHNTTYLTAAYIIQKIFSFFFFVFIARTIGVADVGKYTFALSFTTIFSIFIDLGLSSVLTREAAKNQEKIESYLCNILGVKAILATLTYVAAILAVNLLGKEPLIRELVYISGLIMVFDSFYLTFYAVFRAKQVLKYEAVGMVVGQAIILAAGIVVLLLHLSLHFLVGAILAGSLFNFVYSWLLLTKTGIPLRLRFNKEILKILFKIATPFAVAGIFARVYGYIDSILLSTLAGDRALGWYQAGYKITFALQFVPMAMAAAIFPAMSNYFVHDKKMLARTFEKSMYYLMLIALPITFGVLTLANEFIVAMYGPEFSPTTIALQILICSLVFNFIGFPLGSLLNACNRQTQNTVNMGIAMVINVALNVVLINLMVAQPFVGAAIAALGSAATLAIIGFYYAGQIISYDKKFLLSGFGKILLACLLMSGVILLLKPAVNFLLVVPIAAVVYFLSIYALKGVNKVEIRELCRSFFKKEV